MNPETKNVPATCQKHLPVKYNKDYTTQGLLIVIWRATADDVIGENYLRFLNVNLKNTYITYIKIIYLLKQKQLLPTLSGSDYDYLFLY